MVGCLCGDFMIIYLLHNDKIVSFSLPKNISGSYILSDNIENSKRDLIKIEAVDGKWNAFSSDDVKVSYNKQVVSKIPLVPYCFYQLVLYDTEYITMYVCPGYEGQYTLKMIPQNTILTVGASNKCDIFYSNCGEQQLELKYQDGIFSFSNLNLAVPIYVNLVKKDKGYLKNCDVIFIMGLKIIVIGPYLYINNPGNTVDFFSNKFIDPTLELIAPSYDAKGRIFKDFYSEDDYFKKSPLFHNKIEQVEITIANPPSQTTNKGNPLLLEIIPSAIMSITSLLSAYFTISKYKSGSTDKESFILTIVMCIGMLFTGILWPFIQRGYEKINNAFTLGKTRSAYKKYLKNKKKDINELRLKEQVTLKDVYIDLDECKDAIMKRSSYLYSVNIDSDRFLSIRLGKGTIPFSAKYNFTKPEFTVEHNKLYDLVDNLLNDVKYLNDVPVSISLKEHNVIAFLNSPDVYKYDYAKNLLFQIVTLHSFTDLKIVVLTDATGDEEFSFLKKLGHCWDDAMSMRFFASDMSDALDISTYLENIFVSRSKKETNQFSISDGQYYLIVCDKASMYRDLNIVKDVLNSKINYGFSLVMFDDKVKNIPNKCSYFVNYGLSEATCFESEIRDDQLKKFIPEIYFDHFIDIDKYCTYLANIPMKVETMESQDIPTNLGFLEMYGVGKVEHLNASKRWKEADVVNSLSAPVGVDGNGNIINLDLHEKRHGPHGLVAGMTGSGKSEFIVTYILSLAVNYNPDEVQFVLIDYKGGGLAGAFENRKTGVKLPHLVGTITNLDQSEMNRTLASIQSELKRRQRVFNEAKARLNTGTIDIYKYQKLHREGKIEEPMSHLFIISDEFAELKDQQPEFMDQLVSAARIGRSLGVHLILATQKPSGVVDDQIWSNSKFKVCCKVQTPEDSQEMLGKADAASLKDAGRFYLQVGYDLYYVLGQSAYSGGAYIPSDKIISKVDNSILFVNNAGEIVKSIERDDNSKQVNDTVDLGEELSNVLKYVINEAEKGGFHTKKLWLDNIPDHIYLENIKLKYKDCMINEKGIINTPIGEYDDPENQKQGLVSLPLTLGGNCFIAGVSGSGKSTLLSTFILSTITSHSVDEVNFYIIDFANETLKRFSKAPQVGNVLTMDNMDKVSILLNRVESEIKNRKKILSKHELDYISYVRDKTLPPMPNYIVIINGFDAFREQFSDFIDEKFLSIVRECNKYGITFIITSTDPHGLYASHFDQFPQRIALKFSNPDDYMDFCDSKIVPSTNPGRGIIKIDGKPYQFQTALIVQENIMTNVLNQIFDQLNKIMPIKADQIPVMPDFVTIDQFKDKLVNLSSIPIGYNISTINPSYYNFDNLVNLILSSKSKKLISFLKPLVEMINSIQKVKVLFLDGNKKYNVSSVDGIKYYDSNFAGLVKFLKSNLDKYDKNTDNRIVIFISGYENIKKHLTEYYSKNVSDDNITLEDLIFQSFDSNLYRFVLCGTYSSTSVFENEKWYEYLSKKHGIVIGNSFDDQEIIVAKSLEDEYRLNLDDTNAIVVRNSNKEIITYVSD